MNFDFAVSTLADFSNNCNVGVVAFHDGNTESATFWSTFAVTSLGSCQLEHVLETGLAFQHGHAVLDGVFASSQSHLVNEAFVGETVHVVAHTAPVTDTQTCVMDDEVVLCVGDVVRRNSCFHHERIHGVFWQAESTLCDGL